VNYTRYIVGARECFGAVYVNASFVLRLELIEQFRRGLAALEEYDKKHPDVDTQQTVLPFLTVSNEGNLNA
jgi:hypothetical protein